MERSPEQEHQPKPYELLSPSGFKERFAEDVKAAQHTILINMFLWRNDDFGRWAAEQLLKAAERGVTIDVIKDEVGAIYEYAEMSGSSFLHSDASSVFTHYFQGKCVGLFCDSEGEKNDDTGLSDQFRTHKNITVTTGATYDHSKIIIIDGKTAYILGFNFGDEHITPKNEWSDFAVRLQGEDLVRKLMEKMAGEQEESPQDGIIQINHGIVGNGTDGLLRDNLGALIRETNKQLTMFITYGSPDMARDISSAINNGAETTCIISADPLSRGLNFEMIREVVSNIDDPNKLKVVLPTDNGNHWKGIVANNTVDVGSQNPAAPDGIKETTVTIHDPELAEQMRSIANQIAQNSPGYRGRELVKYLRTRSPLIHARAALEKAGLLANRIIAGLRPNPDSDRHRARDVVRGVIQRLHRHRK
jgi:cardiolipin synthase